MLKASSKNKQFVMKILGYLKQEFSYEINEVNKNGGFGVVYIGRRCNDKLPIAIKVINKSKVSKWTKVEINNHNDVSIINFIFIT